jgi:hypothetical protein
MIRWTKVVGCLKDKEETEAMAPLNRLDVGRLNEVLAIFTRFVKSVEGNSVSYFDTFPMLQKPMANLGSPGGNKHTETLVKAVSERLSRTTDLNIIFTCFLVTPATFRDQARSLQAWKQCGTVELLPWRPRFPPTLPR